ncbi:tetratricopeptide repeat protein [Streptomyces sp. NPDC056817]|uniref:tetratricopeptide repeat protein n=1 Tax=Streptomyces sp. NPDC056817 TaxID=3345950 RepID=UPI0036BE4418
MTQLSGHAADGLELGQGRSVRPVLLHAVPNTAAGLWRDLAEQLALPASSAEECMSRLAASPDTVAVLLDRLHEASSSLRRSIVERVVRPLQALPAVRLVITEDSTPPVSEFGTDGTDVEILRLGAGPYRPDTLADRASRASAHRDAGDLDRAITLYEEILDDQAQALGNGHLDIMAIRYQLAGAYYAKGDLDRVIALYEQTVTDRARLLGPDHPDTLSARNNLAISYSDAGRTQEALELHERVLADSERLLGPDHPSTLSARNNLARARDVDNPVQQRSSATSMTTAEPQQPSTSD